MNTISLILPQVNDFMPVYASNLRMFKKKKNSSALSHTWVTLGSHLGHTGTGFVEAF